MLTHFDVNYACKYRIYWHYTERTPAFYMFSNISTCVGFADAQCGYRLGKV